MKNKAEQVYGKRISSNKTRIKTKQYINVYKQRGQVKE